ncbi:MAG TPA: CHAP domain-containing protein [Chitinophagales bacterium]|nr:CHAP domain-containing protein [Chitinophagales bacterium]
MKLKYIITIVLLLVTAYFLRHYIKNKNPNPKYFVGQKLDSLNGVYVYYNGRVGHTGKRNLSVDGYNIGLEYQCVEFVKRYYYQYYHHKMPDAFGNAKDFFDDTIADRKLNSKRNLIQYKNPSVTKPAVGDLIIFDGHVGNKYGHVAIISAVDDNKIEIIQQNPGAFAKSRVKIDFIKENNKFRIMNGRILGWLRKE